jgi:hypothetical protein
VSHCPIDLVNFVEVFGKVKHDFLLTVAVANIMEPKAVTAFLDSALAASQGEARPVTVEALRIAFDSVLAATDGAPNASEQRTLGHPAGIARHMGSANTLVTWGHIVTAGDVYDRRKRAKFTRTIAPADSRGIFELGLTRRRFARRPDSGQLQSLVEAARDLDKDWQAAMGQDDLAGVVPALVSLMDAFAEKTGVLGPKYKRHIVMRKIILAMVHHGHVKADWGDMSKNELCSFCCDERGHLAAFPDEWSAEEISEFLFGRGDLAMLASMWSCLWGDCFNASAPSRGEGDKEREEREANQEAFLAKLITSGRYAETAEAMRQRDGHWSAPLLVVPFVA